MACRRQRNAKEAFDASPKNTANQVGPLGWILSRTRASFKTSPQLAELCAPACYVLLGGHHHTLGYLPGRAICTRSRIGASPARELGFQYFSRRWRIGGRMSVS